MEESDISKEISGSSTKNESLMEESESHTEISGSSTKNESLMEESDISKEMSGSSTKNESLMEDPERSKEMSGSSTKSESLMEDPERSKEMSGSSTKNESLKEDQERRKEMSGSSTKNESLMEDPERRKEMSESSTKNENLMEDPERSNEMSESSTKNESLMEDPERSKEMSGSSTKNESLIEDPERSKEMSESSTKNDSLREDSESGMEVSETHSKGKKSGKLKKNVENKGPPRKKIRKQKPNEDQDSSKTAAERRRERDKRRLERERNAVIKLGEATAELTGSKPQSKAKIFETSSKLLLQQIKDRAKGSYTEESSVTQEREGLDDSKGSKTILPENKTDLQRHLKEGKITIHHARGILVGCAEAGKTTLLKRLLGQTQDEVEDIESTRGLEVYQHLFNVREGVLEVIGDDKTQNAFLRVSVSDLKRNPNIEVQQSGKSKSKSEDKEEDESKSEDKEEDESKSEDKEEDESKSEDKEEDKSKSEDPQVSDTSAITKDQILLKILNERESLPTVSILDFAGQLAYYACHQIYITPKAFFVLVLDMSQRFEDVVSAEKDNREGSIFSAWTYKDYLKFWINSIKTFGSTKAPLFVVATHTEEKSEEEIEEYMQEFGELVPDEDKDWFFKSLDDREYALGLLELSEKSMEMLESIKTSIVEVVSEYINTKIEVRSSWALLEQSISDGGRKVMTLAEISEINKSLPREYQLKSPVEISKFLNCFHDNGLCLYFKDEGLREHVIWDIQWFANAFSKLIADKSHITKDCKRRYIKEWTSFNSSGELKEQLVDALWKDEASYLDHKSQIVSYMERLLMIVPISSKGATSESGMSWYIPCMNKKVFEKGIFKRNWENSSVLCFRFTSFAMFVFYRLIAYCMGSLKWRVSSDGEGSQALYQTAGVFDYKNHSVVIGINDNDIQVQVMRIKPSCVENEVSQNVGESVETALQELTKTFNEQTVFEKGYKCQNVICNADDRSFTPASELSQIEAEVVQCAHCPISEKHDINVQKILGFWEKRVAEELKTGDKDVENIQTSLLHGEPHRKMFDSSYPYSDGDAIFKSDLCDRIGCIKCPDSSGTGFRVGSNYVITAYHVMEDILVKFWKVVYKKLTEDERRIINWTVDNLPQAGRWSLSNLISLMDPSRQGKFAKIGKCMITDCSGICFGYIDEKPETSLRFSYDVAFASPPHDVVILELMDSRNVPKPLLLTDIFIPGGKLHVIGHPNGIKLQHDPGCKVIDDEKELSDLVNNGIHFFTQHLQGLNERQVQMDYSPCVLSEDRVLFHCSKTTAHGASGSPLIVTKETPPSNKKTALVTGMLLRGHPSLYYNYRIDKEVPPELLLETGISMEKISSLLSEHSLHQLADELFSEN